MCISQFKKLLQRYLKSRSVYVSTCVERWDTHKIHTNYGVVRSKANKNLKNQWATKLRCCANSICHCHFMTIAQKPTLTKASLSQITTVCWSIAGMMNETVKKKFFCDFWALMEIFLQGFKMWKFEIKDKCTRWCMQPRWW